MTRDEVIKMAIDCLLIARPESSGIYADALVDFAELVAAAENEECASIVENADTPDCGGWTAQAIADAIRARKSKPETVLGNHWDKPTLSKMAALAAARKGGA